MQLRTKKIALTGMLIAAAFIFSYLESMLPVFFGIPGIKPGFANIVIIVALYRLGISYAAGISLLRIALSGLMFSGMYSAMYSLAGGILSLVIMIILKKSNRFSVAGISVSGGVAHNIGQIIVALFVLGNAVLYYLPFLMVSGIITGCLVGIVGSLIIRILKGNTIAS